MAASSVAESTSRISIEDDGDARVSCSGEEGLTGGEEFWPVARPKIQSSRTALGRSARCEWPVFSPPGYI
jgi:hypothetical protein